jgi:hypothetical protein
MAQAAENAATSTEAQLATIFPSDTSAQLRNMMAVTLLSVWAIQRDNGGCAGSTDSNTCSGIAQNTWDFSHVLEPFNG